MVKSRGIAGMPRIPNGWRALTVRKIPKWRESAALRGVAVAFAPAKIYLSEQVTALAPSRDRP